MKRREGQREALKLKGAYTVIRTVPTLVAPTGFKTEQMNL